MRVPEELKDIIYDKARKDRRAEYAAMAMQALITHIPSHEAATATLAVGFADALLEELEREQ